MDRSDPGLSKVRELLFGVPMLSGPLPGFEPQQAPEEPFPLFLAWLAQAVADGVSEPHAMTLATVDDAGCPDLRVVALRDAGPDGWSFATCADSPKSRQLAARPQAALGFHWREQGRQIRLRGPVVRAGAEVAAADFLSRLPGSRAATLVGRQSRPLADPALLSRAFAEAHARIAADPGLVDPGHALFMLRPTAVEFWQGDPARGHIRLRYRLDAPAAAVSDPTSDLASELASASASDPHPSWTRELLWP
ncbi:pyridoxamine 5'-phosphate oxidase [Streptacidiphilus sp. MAP12-16]|uniref:pyridoxal 5'-phosphate synthase n=1 Tax=Streptacidiphilus sp. MAP12-16 TaxID=3156300 RepID=UPI00351483AB